MQSMVDSTILMLALLASQAGHPAARAQETESLGPAGQPRSAPAVAPAAEPEPAGPVAPDDDQASLASSHTPREKSIVVTGSHIRGATRSASPVEVISKEQIQASGKLSIGDFLQTLVVQSNAVNSAVNQGNDGSTRVNLRGLGSERTLVLVNGHRLVGGGSRPSSAIDLGAIPSAAVERIEILADGATAVYGADAVAGVVNVVTRTARDGTEVGAVGGISAHGDGAAYDVSLSTGAARSWGSFAATAGFYHQGDVMAGERAFSSVARAYSAELGEYVQGSSATPEPVFVTSPGVTDPSATALFNELVTANPDTSSFVYDPSAPLQWRPYRTSDAYDYLAESYLVTPLQRVQLYAAGDAKLGDVARVYFDASYVNRQSEQLLAAEPLNTRNADIVVSSRSMYNPFGVDLRYVTRRLVEAGGRRFEQDVDTWRVLAGVDGNLESVTDALHGWTWDVSVDYARNQSTDSQRVLKVPALQAALGPSGPVDGQPACLDDGGSVIAGCVPLDLFGGPGSVTADQLGDILYTATAHGDERLVGVQAGASGELFTLAADRPVELALGYEYRGVTGSYTPDPLTTSGETLGNQEMITSGSYYANEGYAELSIPIVSGAPGIDDLEASAAARLSDYDTFGLDWAYQLGLRWKIIPDVTLRGTYGKGPRAPAIAELFLAQSDNFPSVRDPCSLNYTPQCAAVDAAYSDPQTHHRARVGGNPELDPERATTLTVGVLAQPSGVEGLSITLDYYRIAIDGIIGTLGAYFIVNSCYATEAPRYCDLVTRDASGYIDTIYDTNQNAGSLETDGIDLGLRWALATEVGRFGFAFEANWLHAFDRTLPDGTVIHGKGTFDLANYGVGGVYPAVRFGAGVSYLLGGFSADFDLRYIGSFDECGDSEGTFDGTGLCYIDSTYKRTVGAYQIYDLYLSYALDTSAGKTLLGVGVNNLFDAAPERVYNGFLAASDPTAYDYMGRYVFARVVQAF